MAGTEIPGGEERRGLYLTLHCHHHNDSCILMGSDESRFNVSLSGRGKVKEKGREGRTEAESTGAAPFGLNRILFKLFIVIISSTN